MDACAECHAHIDRRRVAPLSTILSVGTVGAIAAVSTGRRIIGIAGARRAADAVGAVQAIHTADARTARKVRDVLLVIAQWNVEIGSEVGMAGHGDRDVGYFAVTDTGILGKRNDALLIDGHDGSCDFKFLPHNLALAFALSG